ncbi:MAG: hypothetical protein ACREOD_09925 [Candidatus Dormibacteria bacterium]
MLRRLRAAGIDATPDDAASLVGGALLAFGIVGAALVWMGWLDPSVAVLLALTAPVLLSLHLERRLRGRRRAITDQLPILVDLMALEQGGGGIGARAAMESVVSQLGGEGARLLRACLAASATPGTPSLDKQLERAAGELGVPELAALATFVRVQREEGVAASSPLGQLARGLRDRQRDELMARGRRALVTMLLPVALCILLPFVVIVLYPALERLSRAFS